MVLQQLLQAKGISCWRDEVDIDADPLREVIQEKIRTCDWVLSAFSEHSIESEWFQRELRWAFKMKRKQTLAFFVDDKVHVDELAVRKSACCAERSQISFYIAR